VDGRYAYVSDYNGGVLIYDVADPSAPLEIARVGFDDPVMGAVLDIDVVGDHAYVASASGLRILDVSDPSQAFEVGRFDTNEVLGEVPQDIHVVGSIAYMPVWMTGMLIMDVTSPDDPSPLASVPTAYAIYKVETEGNAAFIAEGVEGVRVLDISNPASPVELERIQLGKFVWNLERIDGRTVITFGDEPDGSGGIQVIVDR
jgi:hypothetical protein